MNHKIINNNNNNNLYFAKFSSSSLKCSINVSVYVTHFLILTPLSYDISRYQANINMGVKYLQTVEWAK